MPEQLKPCPFCGHTEIRNHNCKTECSYCGARVEFVELADCYDKLNAKDRPDWNDRPIEDALQARITELEGENAKLKEQIITWHKYPDEKPDRPQCKTLHRLVDWLTMLILYECNLNGLRFVGRDTYHWWEDSEPSFEAEMDASITILGFAYLPEPPEVKQ